LGANFENSEILAPILKIFGAKDENASFFWRQILKILHFLVPNLKMRHFWRRIGRFVIFSAKV
jgi:hypothetical protein